MEKNPNVMLSCGEKSSGKSTTLCSNCYKRWISAVQMVIMFLFLNCSEITQQYLLCSLVSLDLIFYTFFFILANLIKEC